jgi:hypothetical protein
MFQHPAVNHFLRERMKPFRVRIACLCMTYQRDPAYWTDAIEYHGNSITICSCVLDGTKVEQKSTKWEGVIMWAKDAAAGAGLILFMVSAFVLASGAHAVLSHAGI